MSKRKRDYDDEDNNHGFVKILCDNDRICRKKSPILPTREVFHGHGNRSFTLAGKSEASSSETITKNKLSSEQTSRINQRPSSFFGRGIARNDPNNNRNPKTLNPFSCTSGTIAKYELSSKETLIKNQTSSRFFGTGKTPDDRDNSRNPKTSNLSPCSSEKITKNELSSKQISITNQTSSRFFGSRIAPDDRDNNRNFKKLRHCDHEFSTARTSRESTSGKKCFEPLKSGETVVRNPIPMSYTCLKKLCENQVSAEEASSRLSENAQLQRFEALLQQNEIRYDLMKLIISAIFKVCQSRVLTHLNNILGVLNNVRFWSILGAFLVELETKKEFQTDSDASSMIKHLCQIFIISLDRLPNIYSRIPLYQLRCAATFFKENGNVAIESTVDNLLTEVTVKCESVKKAIREKNQVQPPDDFRKLSVFPNREDIFKKRKPFLRENVIKKPFPSVDQYLDIHFRLLKEDSLAGLRNGCRHLEKRYKQQQYSKAAVDKSSNARQQNDVIVYSDVVIDEQVIAKNRQGNTKGIVFNIEFNSKHPSIKRVNWARSKRLMYGSLVCLISTDFNKVHFATVQDRNPDMLKEGCVQLCFEGHDYPGYDDTEEKYCMVESSSAYFVAYRHILERLQDMTEETMPFKNYIVFCEHNIDKVIHCRLLINS